MSTAAQQARARRRRRIRERQALVFGALVTALLVVGVLAGGVYLGFLPSPFPSGFTSPSPTGPVAKPVPCPPDGTLPVTPDQIWVNVLNGAGVEGLAGRTQPQLAAIGVNVASVGNTTSYPGDVKIYFGTTGAAVAYTLAAYFNTVTFELDARPDTGADIVLGKQYSGMKDPASVALDPATPFAPPDGCTPIDQIQIAVPTPADAPTDAPTDAPAESPTETPAG